MENDDKIINPDQLNSNSEPGPEPGSEMPESTAPEAQDQEKQVSAKEMNRFLKAMLVILAVITSVILLFLFIIYAVPAIQEISAAGKTRIVKSEELVKSAPYKKTITQMSRDIERLSRKYSNYTTGQAYIVINTTDNMFFLYRNKKLMRTGFCSTGSYKMLITETGKSWTFKTPKGKFAILGKTTHPSWFRPDWSFVEEGLPIPSQDDPSRYEYGVLGDYALAIGEGYLIHGTIYKRFLKMPVTHGCVRLNDDDLSAVYHTLDLGSKVYIY
jgi:lipoprotein-anchoring transpeptidase ErfK/SrfK